MPHPNQSLFMTRNKTTVFHQILHISPIETQQERYLLYNISQKTCDMLSIDPINIKIIILTALSFIFISAHPPFWDVSTK